MTKPKEEDFGTRYRIEGTEEKLYEKTGCPDGTTIVIRDIFYNVPARLKFLKKDVAEGNAIASIVDKIALSHPEIAFKFIRDNRQEFITPGDGDLYSSMYSVMGRQFAASMIVRAERHKDRRLYRKAAFRQTQPHYAAFFYKRQICKVINLYTRP